MGEGTDSATEKKDVCEKEAKAVGRTVTTLETMRRLAVGYIRVSTRRQESDLDSQAQVVRTGAMQRNLTVIEIYDDVASGIGDDAQTDRPGLGDALRRARSLDAPLVVSERTRISRIDGEAERLSREHGVAIICIDTGLLPVSGTTRSSAERFARRVRERTSQALRGAAAGNVRRGTLDLAATRQASIAHRVRFDDRVREIADFLRTEDPAMTLTAREVVHRLNLAGGKTSRGAPWTVAAIRRPLRAAKEQLRFELELDEDPYDSFHGR